jgi:polyisoprenyl-phosphate glycosyltransferase
MAENGAPNNKSDVNRLLHILPKGSARGPGHGRASGTSLPTRPKYSLVLPLFNEEAVLPLLFRRLDHVLAELDGPAEVIMVDDGSSDCTSIIVAARAKDDPRYRYIGLSRNFGQQLAMTAGLDAASGDAVILMDADLQDPPEVIHEMIAKWREGYEIVYARRASRAGESRFKLATARLFYKTMSRLASVDIPQNVGDFRLVDRKALEVFRSMREQDRFVRGMFAWVGFRQIAIEFNREERAAGETKWPVGKLVKLAVNGLVSFSDAPLRLALWLGACVSGMAILYGCYVIVTRLMSNDYVPGWASTIVVVAFLGGANMLLTGILGLYVGRIHNEVKRRPLYIVSRTAGFENVEAQPQGADLEERRRRAG